MQQQQPQYSYPSRLPEVDTPVVVQLAEELKSVPFNMTPHGAYGVARHAVAQLLSPAAAGYPATPQGVPAMLDPEHVDPNLRLIGELRAEVAALKAAMALTNQQRLLRACVALGGAAKKLRSSENIDTLGDRLEREAKFCSGQSADELALLGAARADQLREAVRDAVIAGLSGTYYCGRVWSAWNIGTMSQQDFTPAAEVSEVVDEITGAVLATFGK
jgi:hypothetical protein